MARLQWGNPQDQSYEAGLDRGVIYTETKGAVAWNGLRSVEAGGESETVEFHLDGIKFLTMATPRDWQGTLTAISYPDLFEELIGFVELGDGLFGDSQLPDRFNLSYRTMVSSPNFENKKYYKIHLIYNVVAAFSSSSYESLDPSSLTPAEFEFELSATPIRIPEGRPTAHIVIDSRVIDDSDMAILEGILYGDDMNEPSFPDIDTLIDMLRFTNEVSVVDNGDGTWTATGSNANINRYGSNRYFLLNNVDAETVEPGIYELQTTE